MKKRKNLVANKQDSGRGRHRHTRSRARAHPPARLPATRDTANHLEVSDPVGRTAYPPGSGAPVALGSNRCGSPLSRRKVARARHPTGRGPRASASRLLNAKGGVALAHNAASFASGTAQRQNTCTIRSPVRALPCIHRAQGGCILLQDSGVRTWDRRGDVELPRQEETPPTLGGAFALFSGSLLCRARLAAKASCEGGDTWSGLVHGGSMADGRLKTRVPSVLMIDRQVDAECCSHSH